MGSKYIKSSSQRAQLRKKANKLIQAVSLGGQLHADWLTSSHHCRPLNDHTRVRTALRHPLFDCGSLRDGAGEEIGHLVVMSFVKNADIGFWEDVEPRTNPQSEYTHTHTHTCTHTLLLICSWLEQVWHSTVVNWGHYISNTPIVTPVWIHTSFWVVLSVWLEAVKRAFKHTTSEHLQTHSNGSQQLQNKAAADVLMVKLFWDPKANTKPSLSLYPSPPPLVLSRVTRLRIVGVLIRGLQPRHYKWQPGLFYWLHMCAPLRQK